MGSLTSEALSNWVGLRLREELSQKWDLYFSKRNVRKAQRVVIGQMRTCAKSRQAGPRT